MFADIFIILAMLSASVFAVPLRVKPWLTLVVVAAGAAVGIGCAVDVLVSGESISLSGGSNIFGRGIVVIDRLSAFFILVISVTALSVTIYAGDYLKSYYEKKTSTHISLHWMSIVLLYCSMIFVVTCRDAYGFLLAWELMTISSFLLILFDGRRREIRRVALNYLVLMHIGFIFLLTGFVIVSVEGLPATFDSLGIYFARNNPIPLFIVFLIGFGMKAGIFPLHLWLPEAHPAAPAHISAFMSGVMIKMGAYGVIRMITYMQGELLTAGIILFAAGAVTGLWGVILAAVQNDIKRLLAYSSIENMGIVFMAVGISAIGAATDNAFLAGCAMTGALLHIANHSFFKSLLFFGAGSIYRSAHTTSIDSLGGLAKKMPLTAGLFLLGAAAISALPPLNGFVSEFFIYYGLFDSVGSGEIVIIAICGIVALSLIGGIVILAFSKLFGVVFLGSPRSADAASAVETGRRSIIASAIPAAGIISVGLMPFLFTEGLFSLSSQLMGTGDAVYAASMGRHVFSVVTAFVILIVCVVLLLVYRRIKLRGKQQSQSPVWGCGFTKPSPKMQYSGESFSEGLYGITSSMTKNSGGADVVGKDEIFPNRHSFDLRRKDKVSTLFSSWRVEAMRRINARVARLSTGKVNHYILYALLFLVLIFLLSITGAI